MKKSIFFWLLLVAALSGCTAQPTPPQKTPPLVVKAAKPLKANVQTRTVQVEKLLTTNLDTPLNSQQRHIVAAYIDSVLIVYKTQKPRP